MEKANNDDISTFVHSRMPYSDNSELAERIISKAKGIFLWVALVTEELLTAIEDGETPVALQRKLESIPSDLTERFTQIISSIPQKRRRETRKVMLWVLLAGRPLTPTEFRYALAFSQPYQSYKEGDGFRELVESDENLKKLLRKWSRRLVEIVESPDGARVQFIHESVREFLIN